VYDEYEFILLSIIAVLNPGFIRHFESSRSEIK